MSARSCRHRRPARAVVSPSRAEGDQTRFLVVGHYSQNVVRIPKFLGSTGRVATGDYDFRRRIRASEPSNGLARPLIGTRRHRAGVDNDDIGLIRRVPDCSVRAQLLLEAQRIGLVHAASERNDGILHSALRDAFRPMSRRYCMPSN